MMSDQHERLRRAFKERGLSQAECIQRFGWNRNTLKANLNGNGTYGFEAAKVYATAFRVRAEWLYDGAEPMRDPGATKRPLTEVPVISWVSAGRLSDIGQLAEVDDGDRLVVGDLPSGDYFATDVRGDSMDRVSPEGSRIIVNAADRTPKPGGYYVFSVRGDTTFKRYQKKPVERLEPFSTNPANQIIFLGDDEWSVIGRVVRSFIDLV